LQSVSDLRHITLSGVSDVELKKNLLFEGDKIGSMSDTPC